MYSGDPEILIDRQTAFALCSMGAFVFAFDSYCVRAVLMGPPKNAVCVDLADVFDLDRPTGLRRTLHLFIETYGSFHVLVGEIVKVETVPLVNVYRLPAFIAHLGTLHCAMAIIDHDNQFSFLVDAPSLAQLHQRSVQDQATGSVKP